ncbi:MAG TPA: ATP-binding protein [Puia sp.]|nr:ATP-binding protein [Puia sp.]
MSFPRTEALVVFCFIACFILVMVSFIIAILFRVQKKQKAFNDKLMETKENHLKELFGTKLEVHEKISEDLSRELHDNIGQNLSIARVGLNTLDIDNKDESKHSISEISEIIEKSLDDLRTVCRTMNSEIIKKGGLKKSIEMQVGYMRRLGKSNINFNTSGEYVRLVELKEMVLFRIIQEAMSNIIRHSGATEICISLCYSINKLILMIQDNGIGFDMDELAMESNHLNGIYNMKHRARLIEAEFKLESKIGVGTTITVTTPY